MPNIFVDPIIVAAPSANAAANVVAVYLDALYQWLEEALNSPHNWLYSDKAIAKLWDNDQYPDPKLLQDWSRIHGDQIDVNIGLISRWLAMFFNPEFNLEQSLENLGYLIEPEEQTIIIQPETYSLRWQGLMRDEMSLLLAKTCAYKHIGFAFTNELYIATLAFKCVNKEIVISTKILDSEPAFDWQNIITYPFPLLFTPDDLPPPTDILLLWDKGEQGMRYAIDRWCKQDWQHSVAWEYRFRASFFETIREAELDVDMLVLMKIVRAAAAIITNNAKGVEKYRLRQLRESKTADSKQRTRLEDNAKAWRLTIVPDGAGWCMHYWQVPAQQGSVIELANILKEQAPREIY